jgi:SRSO17 transposase
VDTRWHKEFEKWLEPFVEALSPHPHNRRSAPLYVKGLVLPGERKSLQPLAVNALGKDSAGYQSLHHFLSDSPWETAPLESQLVHKAKAILGGAQSVLVVDDTALPKKGRHSVGVAPQYCGALGKKANCQCVVTLTLARGEVPLCVGTRLFLPQEWTEDPGRCAKARVPQAVIDAGHRTKGELALEQLDGLITMGLSFGSVLADAGYGNSAQFRQALSARNLTWGVGIQSTLNVYPGEVKVTPVTQSGQGRPRLHATPSEPAISARKTMEALKPRDWKLISWRAGTKGSAKPLEARFAALRVCPADAEKISKGVRLPGEQCWLVAERRSHEETRYYLTNLPPEATLNQLAALIKARWICEQAHQQMKEELGLDHFEGRSWVGLDRHMLFCRIAYCFLQHLRLEGKKKTRLLSGSTKTHAA